MSELNPQVHSSARFLPPSGSYDGHLSESVRLSEMEEEVERVERMAGRMIEQAMTAIIVRTCWHCQRRFVKTTGCSEVVCLCGAKTCHRCGGRIEQRHRCTMWLPEPTWRSIRRAAWFAKRHLRHRYPGIQFKYDPSRRFAKFRRFRRYRRRD